jgi:hypothetical protein
MDATVTVRGVFSTLVVFLNYFNDLPWRGRGTWQSTVAWSRHMAGGREMRAGLALLPAHTAGGVAACPCRKSRENMLDCEVWRLACDCRMHPPFDWSRPPHPGPDAASLALFARWTAAWGPITPSGRWIDKPDLPSHFRLAAKRLLPQQETRRGSGTRGAPEPAANGLIINQLTTGSEMRWGFSAGHRVGSGPMRGAVQDDPAKQDRQALGLLRRRDATSRPKFCGACRAAVRECVRVHAGRQTTFGASNRSGLNDDMRSA